MSEKEEKYKEALVKISSNLVFSEIPSFDYDNAELARYVFPERIKFLQEIAKDALQDV